jgi:protein disulfide-isomerase A6
VKLAAVNCDEDENKQFCGSMGVKGFPTLKIVKPGKKSGTPIVEDYNGPREAKAIIDTMVGRIPNHVKRIADKDLDAFLAEGNATAKAILFTEKGTTSALLKAVAIDFLGSISVAQIRSKETAAVELFGVTTFPSIILLPGGDAEGIVYEGEMKKDAIVAFLAQVAAPNPDPAPAKVKMPTKKADKAEKAAKESFESASSSHQSSEASSGAASATEETLEEASQPTESPEPAQDAAEKPIVLPEVAPPIPILATGEELALACLAERSGTCVIAFVPKEHDETASQALSSLAEIAHKHKQARRKLFPFYEVPDDITDSATVKKTLSKSGKTEIVAINRKRGWYRNYESQDMSIEAVEAWIDQIRMGEGPKLRLPDAVLTEKIPNPAAAEQPIEKRAEEEHDPKALDEEPTPETAADKVTEEKTDEPEATAVVVDESVIAEESAEPTVKDEL